MAASESPIPPLIHPALEATRRGGQSKILRLVFLAAWVGLAAGGILSRRGSIGWLTALVLPVIGVGLFHRVAWAQGLAVASALVVAAGIFFGISGIQAAGCWLLLGGVALLLGVEQVQRRFQESRWRTQSAIAKKSVQALLGENGLYHQRLQEEEEGIRSLAELYGLTKGFLATLDLEGAIRMTGEALSRWMPQMSLPQREQYLKTVEGLIERGEVTVESLLQAMPLAGTDYASRERWGIVSTQLALGLRRVALYRRVQESAIRDGLTNLLTRRFFRSRLEEELNRAARRGAQLVFLMVDLDRFKEVNDTFGHLVGDVVLREVAERIRHSVREVDVVGRYGGEEFGVLLPDADPLLGVQIAERIRKTVEESVVHAYDDAIRVTVSVGGALYPDHAGTAASLLERADAAMYQAKRAGRNRTVFCEGQVDA